MGEMQDAIDEAVGKKWRRVITIAAVLAVVYFGLGAVLHTWPFSSAAGVVQKVTSSEAIIANYQWFYDQKSAIDAQRANLNALAKDAPERAGLSMVLNNMASEYNSRSKQVTRNLWKAPDLPYQIELGGAK